MNESAFPGVWRNESDRNAKGPHGEVVPPWADVVSGGMTLRDYFAAKAMQSIVQTPLPPDHYSRMAATAYAIADAMLAVRRS